jgi:hypothetical protein
MVLIVTPWQRSCVTLALGMPRRWRGQGTEFNVRGQQVPQYGASQAGLVDLKYHACNHPIGT